MKELFNFTSTITRTDSFVCTTATSHLATNLQNQDIVEL